MPSANDAVTEAAGTLDSAAKALGGLKLWDVVWLVVLVAACLLVSKLVLMALERMLRRGKVEKMLHTFIKSIARVLLAFLSLLIVADHLGIPITSLVALFSVIGLALSLAVQGLLSNLAGGITILWNKPFHVGDLIESGGVTGTVQDITLMYTKVMTPDNRLVYLTNKQVADEKLVNVTGGETRRVELTITASYDAPVEAVKEAILTVIGQHPMTLATPAPLARVGGYGDSAIAYHVRAWCAAGDYWDVYYDLHEQIKAAFDERGIAMTYPHLNVHMMPEESRET